MFFVALSGAHSGGDRILSNYSGRVHSVCRGIRYVDYIFVLENRPIQKDDFA